MVLRKPYALFIKHFRLINLVMALLMAFLIYRTWTIANFFSRYIDDYVTASNGFIVGNYINFYSFLLALMVVILNVLVLSVLIVKNKPKKLYIVNLALYALLIILYGADYMILRGIGEAILDVRISKAFHDITFIAFGLQVAAILLTLVRATGFDIKGFNFGADLQQLNIDTKDNEEFEVAVEFDRNKMNRGIRKFFRDFSYAYHEHKFIINVILIIAAIIIAFIFFMNFGIYRANHTEGKIFQASSLAFNVKNSYITQTDQNGKLITYLNGQTTKDLSVVVVKLDVRTLSKEAEDVTLNTGLITLRIDNKSYAQTNKYNYKLTDIGSPYIGQALQPEFVSYILAFEIPTDARKKTMTLKINDNVSYVKGQMGAKSNYITLKPKDLTQKEGEKTEQVKESLLFSGSILGDSEFIINDFMVGNKFKTSYNFCSKKDHCYTSYEYVTPTATGNYLKTLIRIDGKFELDSSSNIENAADLYYFLNKYGEIHYKVNDKWYSHKIDSQKVKPATAKDNYYYIEANKDIEKATEIYFTFKVRNYNYKYILKQQ